MDLSTSSSSSDDEFIFMLFKEERKRKRRYWVHPILEEREVHGDFRRLIKELKLYHDRFHRYFRVSVSQFESLLKLVAPSLCKSRTNFRKPINPEQRLAVCLRFLGTGDSYRTIASSLSLGISTVARVVAETCDAIWSCLKDEYMPVPTEDVWRSIAKRFQERWSLPNCLGVIDGKRIAVQSPGNSATFLYDYKGTFSVVLLTLTDADYRFLVVDVGSCGSSSDVGIFTNSALGKALQDGAFNFPAPAELPGAPELGKVNHVIVANETFPLKPYLLRPYPGRQLLPEMKVFNCRLSRARQVSENCFSNLSQRFRFFQRRLQVSPAVADSAVKAACILCNYVSPSEQNIQDLQEDDGSGCVVIEPLRQMGGYRASHEAQSVRNTYKKYFNSPAGQVDWQYEHVSNGLGGD
ncbi:uncharacterized protein [Danio rerio]|uniref:DDE Tnp4 domain-containing protein n=1 Tax=Danio rerio TaxID=7955 RepID=A0A8M3AWI4_DANRE|nr:protein ALP1-like [Danio rerio]|eukprot:XP_009303385.1 protein ALP1-like [Danio rerio]